MKLFKTITLLTLFAAAAVPAHGMQRTVKRRRAVEKPLLTLCHDAIGIILSFIYYAKDSDSRHSNITIRKLYFLFISLSKVISKALQNLLMQTLNIFSSSIFMN